MSCNSTSRIKILQLQVVFLAGSQFIHLSLTQYISFPSFKLSTCPASSVRGDFWACIIGEDPNDVSKAIRTGHM
jgi:hypothetical protein